MRKKLQQQPERFSYIDSLRAIAALLVLWRHTSDAFSTLPGAQSSLLHNLATQLNVGAIGVILFFGISGYVIPASLKENDSLQRFAILRFFRLYPAFWLSIVPGAYTSYWIWNQPFSWKELLLNLTMVPGAWSARPAIGLYWTLRVELIFYALCALLAAFGLLRRTGALIISVAVLVLLYMGMRLTTPLPLFLAIMFFGAILRSYHDGTSNFSGTLLFLILFAAGLIIVGPAYAFFSRGAAGFMTAQIFAVGLSIFLIGTTMFKIRSRLLSWLGLISYSFYLFHPVIFNLQLKWLITAAPTQISHLPMAFHIAITVVMTSALAAAVYYFLELPMIRFGRRYVQDLAHGSMASGTLTLARPNKLHLKRTGGVESVELVFDGKR